MRFPPLKTLLGDKYVDLRSQRFSGPWLQNDSTIQGTIGPELEAVVQSGTKLFDAIPPSDLSTVIGNLAEGARGHGTDVARNIEANAELSSLFARTLPPQIRALNDFDVIFAALKSKSIDLNRLADAVNVGAPVYASPRAHRLLDQALTAVRPFANNLADGSGEAPFTNFMGGQGFPQTMKQLCGALPQQMRKQVPICTQARYR